MRIATIRYKVYSYDELSEESREKAINHEICLMLELYNPEFSSKNFNRAVEKAEAMQTQWFTSSYVWEWCKDEILETLRSQEYTDDGKVF